MGRWLALIAVVVSLVACGAAAPTATMTGCAATGGQQVYALLEGYSVRWTQAAERADTAQLAAMGAEIEALKAIRNELNGQQFPTCGKAAQAAFVAWMDTIIEGFTAEMQQKPRAESNAIFERARAQQDALKAELQKLPR